MFITEDQRVEIGQLSAHENKNSKGMLRELTSSFMKIFELLTLRPYMYIHIYFCSLARANDMLNIKM